MLAALWPEDAPAPVWQRRPEAPALRHDDMIWDILEHEPPAIAQQITAVVVLAGVTAGSVADLAQNTALAQAGCALARKLGIKALVVSSQAVYGRATGALGEDITPQPATPYGQAKWEMEQAVRAAGVTCLRIGNVAGCDGLFAAMARGPLTLDQFPDGQSPRRMMIGPRDLASVLACLSALDQPLPQLLNVANPGLLAMNALADAAGVSWTWQPAPAQALPVLEMDVSALLHHVNLTMARAPDMVAQARAGGWSPAV